MVPASLATARGDCRNPVHLLFTGKSGSGGTVSVAPSKLCRAAPGVLMEGDVKALLVAPLCLVLAAGGASASDGPLAAGRPAGVHPAGLGASTTEIAVGA